MRQVFYIDADEEMISVIGRLRRSPASENIIVAPHRSLILQSIVNLRLLNHDARKNGKEIIVVTQDDQSRSLCEKAGIRTQAVLDDEYAQSNGAQYASAAPMPVQTSYQPQAVPREEMPANERSDRVSRPFADALGTSDFFGGGFSSESSTQQQIPQEREMPRQPSMESMSGPSYGDVKQVFVRDNNPKKLTTLNSHRFEEEKLLNQQKSFTPPSLRGAPSMRPVFMPSPPAPAAPPLPVTQQPRMSQGRNLGFLEQQHKKPELRMPIAQQPPKMPEKQVVVSDGGKMRAFFVVFGIISILSVAGVFAYLFLPKADVRVKLKAVTQKADFEFDGALNAAAPSAESKTIPIRVIEKNQDVTRSFDATGKASLADQKARGSVTIYNEFSADKQTLVASTRLMSQDGKVFRLLSGVTVPGMTTVGDKIEPGVIEAVVTADQPGQEYNVGPTTFTVPGFEGSPKFSKFYAKSSKAMTGGGTSGADALSVSDQDIAKAKKAIEAEAKEVAESIANEELKPGEKILSEAIETTIVSQAASPQSGAVTDTFEYRMKIHVKTFAFSEDDLRVMATALLSKQSSTPGPALSPTDVELQYGEPNEDFTLGTLRINVHAVARSESDLDEAQLKSDLLGQDEKDVAVLLQKYSQIDSISMDLWPQFLSSHIPTRKERVTITIEPLDTASTK
ncbi:MAG: hypothetical protein PHT88_00140 [Candidatus Moranbacteria bacterium]|nr:hypothetical protein [Candidatus Moranbacteria bacterium]